MRVINIIFLVVAIVIFIFIHRVKHKKDWALTISDIVIGPYGFLSIVWVFCLLAAIFTGKWFIPTFFAIMILLYIIVKTDDF